MWIFSLFLRGVIFLFIFLLNIIWLSSHFLNLWAYIIYCESIVKNFSLFLGLYYLLGWGFCLFLFVSFKQYFVFCFLLFFCLFFLLHYCILPLFFPFYSAVVWFSGFPFALFINDPTWCGWFLLYSPTISEIILFFPSELQLKCWVFNSLAASVSEKDAEKWVGERGSSAELCAVFWALSPEILSSILN